LAKKLGRGGVREGGFALNPTRPDTLLPKEEKEEKMPFGFY
jgi:hypothetical protein